MNPAPIESAAIPITGLTRYMMSNVASVNMRRANICTVNLQKVYER